MTKQPDDRQPDDPATGPTGAEPALSEDALWELIVANYGDRPDMFADNSGEPTADGAVAGEPATDAGAAPVVEPGPVVEPVETRSVFDRTYVDSQRVDGSAELDTPATCDDEGHFVPPPPPPLPVPEPRRRLAWAGLFGAPLLMVLAVVFGWTYPTWVLGLLVVAFVGGFVYLVATMTRSGGDWPGDDGAVV